MGRPRLTILRQTVNGVTARLAPLFPGRGGLGCAGLCTRVMASPRHGSSV